ncbi:MAG: hypothetical protein NZ608_07055 [candidate division WOR-3 bacterium]|nr:hypothetical protein [candidate division WOR-3 bacterium]
MEEKKVTWEDIQQMYPDVDIFKEDVKKEVLEFLKTEEGQKILEEEGILKKEKVEEKKEEVKAEKVDEETQKKVEEITQMVLTDLGEIEKNYKDILGDKYDILVEIAKAGAVYFTDKLERLVKPSEVMKELVEIFGDKVLSTKLGEMVIKQQEESKKTPPSAEGGGMSGIKEETPRERLERLRKELGLPPEPSWGKRK